MLSLGKNKREKDCWVSPFIPFPGNPTLNPTPRMFLLHIPLILCPFLIFKDSFSKDSLSEAISEASDIFTGRSVIMCFENKLLSCPQGRDLVMPGSSGRGGGADLCFWPRVKLSGSKDRLWLSWVKGHGLWGHLVLDIHWEWDRCAVGTLLERSGVFHTQLWHYFGFPVFACLFSNLSGQISATSHFKFCLEDFVQWSHDKNSVVYNHFYSLIPNLCVSLWHAGSPSRVSRAGWRVSGPQWPPLSLPGARLLSLLLPCGLVVVVSKPCYTVPPPRSVRVDFYW